MLVIGLTGGIGSGKTTVAALFAEKGIKLIDTDQLAREVTKPGELALEKIAAYFGEDILLADHTLNRRKLRDIIFSNHEARIWLEKLLHPLIRIRTKEEIQLAQSPYCIVIIPLLFETEKNPLINRTLVVDSTEELQIERAGKRDNLQAAEIKAIIETQINRKERLAAADDIIYNFGDLSALYSQVNRLHEFYLQLSKNISVNDKNF